MLNDSSPWDPWFSASAPQLTPELQDALAAIEVGRTLDAEERDPTAQEMAILAKRDFDATVQVPEYITGGNWSQMPPIPVFVIHFNRGRMLRAVIESYRQQTVPVEIFVHDNGSNGPDTLAQLAELEKEGIQVFRRAKLDSVRDLDNVGYTIAEVFATRPASPYIVTDCDIELLDPNAIAVYLDLLIAAPQALVVGPMLRIEDIDTSIPLFNNIMNRNIQEFWRKSPRFTSISGKPVAYQAADIDTTFAVLRPGQKFQRMQPGLRVYAPYDARHLDWYVNDWVDEYRPASNPNVAHYSNPDYVAEFSVDVLEHSVFPKITPQADGTLKTEIHRIPTDISTWPPARMAAELVGLRGVLTDKDRHIRNLELQLNDQAKAISSIQHDYEDSRTWKAGKLLLHPLNVTRALRNPKPATSEPTGTPAAQFKWTRSGLREVQPTNPTTKIAAPNQPSKNTGQHRATPATPLPPAGLTASKALTHTEDRANNKDKEIGKVAKNTLRRIVHSKLRREDAAEALPEHQFRTIFDESYYLTHNPDVAAAGIAPFDHYFTEGRFQGRRPSLHFDPKFYLKQYPDVAAAGEEPLSHYLRIGSSEGRLPTAGGFDAAWYLTQHPELANSPDVPLIHFIETGLDNGFAPNSTFNFERYRRANPDIASSSYSPFLHFLEFGSDLDSQATSVINHHEPSVGEFQIVLRPGAPARINLVLDSVPTNATRPASIAIVLAAMWAKATGRKLRVLTTMERPDPSRIAELLTEFNVAAPAIDLDFAPAAIGAPIEASPDDLFFTTNWRATKAVRKSIGPQRLVYLISNDERTQYPYGDNWLAANQEMNNAQIKTVIQTQALYDALIQNGVSNIAKTGIWFEPSAAAFLANPAPRVDHGADRGAAGTQVGAPYSLVALADPTDPQTLFRALVAGIEWATEHGGLDKSSWQIKLLGNNAKRIVFANSNVGIPVNKVTNAEYRQLLQNSAVGVALSATATPGIAPYEMAGSGLLVVTNTWPGKPDFKNLGSAVITCEPEPAAIGAAILSATQQIEQDGEPHHLRFPTGDVPQFNTWQQNLKHVIEHLRFIW